MRDRETIDSELRLIALRRQAILEQGGQPSYQRVDELLDERLGHLPEATGPIAAGDAAGSAPRRRKGAMRRFGPLAALPLSLLAAASLFTVMFVLDKPQPAQPAADPPPSSARPVPAAPQAHAPPPDLVDRAFIEALRHDGVPVPSQEYVTTQGHAVCDFLTHQPDFAAAVRFVQRSSTWDADQSTNVVAGAVVSYCPQNMPTAPAQPQPGSQNALPDVQAIENDLQRIQGDLQKIRDGLPAIPGHQ